MTRFLCGATLIVASVLGPAAPARADFIFTPFVGTTFAPETTIRAAETLTDTKKWTLGVSGTWLTAGVLGIEGEFSWVPRFFDSGQLLSTGSNVTTLMGNVIIAVPLSVTRESLRPYLSGGFGMLHAGADDTASVARVDRNLPAFSIGGGAIGFLNNRTGVRFDLRHLRSTRTGLSTTTGTSESRLGFWRASVGVAIRY